MSDIIVRFDKAVEANRGNAAGLAEVHSDYAWELVDEVRRQRKQIESLQRDKEITEKAYIAQFDRAESLQRENEELRRIASEKHDEVLALEAAAITPEMREELSAALIWIEKQIDSGSDVTISRLHEHSTFGPAVVVSVRLGYSSPVRFYGKTLPGAIATAANSDLLGEQG